MRFSIPKVYLRQNLPEVLRKCGYFSSSQRIASQLSYIKRLSKSQNYPRFHLYIKETNQNYQFNLHLDQKKPSYLGQKAHSGEYDEPLVKEEVERIKSIFNNK